MTTHTTVRSWRAMLVAALFIGGTCFVLFQDLLHGAELTSSHVLSILALVAATAAGHSWVAAFRDGRMLLGFGLAVVAIAAIGYIVTASASRNAESAAAKAIVIEAANKARPGILKKKAEAEFLLSACPAGFTKADVGVKCGLRQSRDAECASGKGSKCDGRSYSVTTYEAAITGYDKQLAQLGPEATANAGYKAAAELWVAARGGNVVAVEQALILFMPFLAVLITELGTVVFLSMALGHAPSVEAMPDPLPPKAAPVPAAIAQPESRRDAVVSWVAAYEAKHGRKPKLKELMEAHQIPKSTASRYRAQA